MELLITSFTLFNPLKKESCVKIKMDACSLFFFDFKLSPFYIVEKKCGMHFKMNSAHLIFNYKTHDIT